MSRLLWTLLLLFSGIMGAWSQQNPGRLYSRGTGKAADRFTPLPPGQVRFTGGLLATRFDLNESRRLLNVDENDLLDCFERRTAPHQAWQGEHAGKFLHAATLTWACTRNPNLKAKIDRVASRLLATQEPDGYLGTYIDKDRWTEWDVWVHKYDLLGLLTYYEYTGNTRALAACRRIGDLLAQTFGTAPGQRDINKAGDHVGMAATSVLEPIVLLYRASGDDRYLKFAHYIVDNYDAPGGPRVLSTLTSTGSVVKVADAKAYEMASNFNGMLELYRATGDRRLLNAMLTGWGDITAKRLYITGSGSNYENWTEDGKLPNDSKVDPCETCVTVTWEQMNLHLLRLTGESRFADQAETTIYNQLLGAQKPTGEAWDYYTSLEGVKPYTTKTNCCLSSGPRGIALLPSIAYMRSDDGGVVVNLFASSLASASVRGGSVTLRQTTDYPRSGQVKIDLVLSKVGLKFPLRVRIPHWAESYELRVDGEPVPGSVVQGGYLVLNRAWPKACTVLLNFPMSPKVVRGTGSNLGKVAVTYGPLVFAADSAFDKDLANLELDPSGFTVIDGDAGEFELKTDSVLLVPFAFAGADGKSSYQVWLKSGP